MIDPGGHFIFIKLHQWYRRRSLPHGTVDIENRGARMAYNNSYRVGACLMMLGLIGPSYVMYFVPSVFAGKSPLVVVAIKSGWTILQAAILLTPVKAFREFFVINEDGLMRSNLFGTQTRMGWHEVKSVRITMNDSEVTFTAKDGAKLKASLCYNGWHDFLEMSAKHLNPRLHSQLLSVVSEARVKVSHKTFVLRDR